MATSSFSSSSSSKDFPTLASLCVNAFYQSPVRAVDSFRKNHLQLCTSVSQANLDRKSRLLLAKNLADNTYCIFTTGSDGRSEKLSDSEAPVELVVYSSDKLDQNTVSNLQKLVMGKPGFFEDIESKDKNSKLCESSGKTIPARGLHSKFLVGNERKYEEYLRELIVQIKNMVTKEYASFKKDFVKSSISSLNKTKSNEKTDAVDLKRGIIFFDGKDFKKKATKYCHLRSIQYKLDKVICDHIRNTPLSDKEAFEFLTNMPSNINDLLDYLYAKKFLGKISFDEKEILKKAYNLSLMYLHIAQNLYVAMKKPIEICLDENQLKELQDNFNATYEILQKIQ